jgi:hypothetical protein
MMQSLVRTMTPNIMVKVTLNKVLRFGTHAGPPRGPHLHLVFGTLPSYPPPERGCYSSAQGEPREERIQR